MSFPAQTLTSLRSRILRTVFPIVEDCRSAMGIRRGLHSGGVYYKELSPERLGRALSKRGTGHKDFRVTFPDGTKQLIRCSQARCYADLMGPEGAHRYIRLNEILRPGMRVIEVVGPPMATGYTSAMLADTVAPSGAVVSLLGDPQGALFAMKRYSRLNLAIEPSPPDPLSALVGETDGAFEAAVCLNPLVPPEKLGDLARGIWRVLAPGGWMVLGVPRGHAEALDRAIASLTVEHRAEAGLISDPDEPGGGSDALLRKPG